MEEKEKKGARSQVRGKGEEAGEVKRLIEEVEVEVRTHRAALINDIVGSSAFAFSPTG